MTAIGSSVNVGSIDSNKTASAPAAKVVLETKAVKLSQDQVNIGVKTGVMPAFKGAGAGLLAGAAGGAMLGAVVAGAKYAPIGITIGGALAAIPGAIIGGTMANVTDNKWKGALYGAAAGATVGAGTALVAGKGRDFGSVALYGALGAVSGFTSGLAGAAVAQKK